MASQQHPSWSGRKGAKRQKRMLHPQREPFPAAHPMMEGNEVSTLSISLLNAELRCPICLGLLKDPVATECLHRFCNTCIEKCLRLGKKECPSCRSYVATRRSLRKDQNFAGLVRTLYPDLDEFEGEEQREICENNQLVVRQHQQKMRNEWQRQRARRGSWESVDDRDAGYGTGGASESESGSSRNGANVPGDDSGVLPEPAAAAEDTDGDDSEDGDADEEAANEEESRAEAEAAATADAGGEADADTGAACDDEARASVAVSGGKARQQTEPTRRGSASTRSTPRKLVPRVDEVGFWLLRHPLETQIPALRNIYVTVKAQAQILHVKKYLAKYLAVKVENAVPHAVDWQAFKVSVIGMSQLSDTLTLDEVVHNFKLDSKRMKLQFQYFGELTPKSEENEVAEARRHADSS